jgi:hypothetical protein
MPRLVLNWTCAMVLATLAACSMVAPSEPRVDVLDYLIGPPALWPRHGEPNHHQHQNLEADRVCWTKYTLGWSFECWRWDSDWIYHVVDHAIDGRRWEHYTFSDGRWMPRWIAPGKVWELDVIGNEIRWFDAECTPLAPRPFPYRVRAWLAGPMDAGGDLGVRDTLLFEYTPDVLNAPLLAVERFRFAKGAGWFEWERADGARVTFNQLGGVARPPTPWCRRDFEAGP